MRTPAIVGMVLFCASFAHAETRALVPVVGSTAGAYGSFFRTELQLNNRSLQLMSGTIFFRPQGQSATSADPSLRYVLEPHQTIHFADVISAMSASGLGSMDIVSDGQGIPTVVARAYDDKGEAGTAGTTVPAIAAREALTPGRTAWLVVPRNLDRYRFNIGVRTLDEETSVIVTIFGANGIPRKNRTMTFPREYFVQQPSDAFVADTLLPDESIAISVSAGSLIVYGTTTDNLTNDPSIQLATGAFAD
jgi:hypothetical protein